MARMRLIVASGALVAFVWSASGAHAVPDSAVLPIEQCQLPGRADLQVSLGFVRPEIRVPSRGRVRAKIVLVDFADAQAKAQLREQAVQTVRSVGAFLTAASYGRFHLVADITERWVRMPHTAALYSAQDDGTYDAQKQYIADAVAASGVDLLGVDVLIVVASFNIGGMAGGTAFVPLPEGDVSDGRLIDNALTVGTIRDGTDAGVLAHEFLHTLGLEDLYASVARPGEDYPYTGPFSLMADVAAMSPSPTAWERWVLGWVDDSQVRCIGPGTSTVSLTPIEVAGGMKAAVAPISAQSAVVVESRASIGSDRRGPAGVIVYLVDPTKEGGQGPIRMARRAGSVMTPLGAGQSITLRGVGVTVLADGRVRVVVPERPA